MNSKEEKESHKNGTPEESLSPSNSKESSYESEDEAKTKGLKTAQENEDETVEDSDKDSDEESDEENDVKVDDNFKEKVMKWIEYDDIIRQKEKECKELKNKRKELEEYVLKFLENNDINIIEINGGKLRRNKSETKTALTNENIKKAIKKKYNDEKTVEEIMKLMDEMRPMKTHVNLKRTFERTKKPNKK